MYRNKTVTLTYDQGRVLEQIVSRNGEWITRREIQEQLQPYESKRADRVISDLRVIFCDMIESSHQGYRYRPSAASQLKIGIGNSI